MSAVDAAAIKRIDSYGTNELERVQARGEKWIAGVTALTGLVTSALVIKGKESFAKLEPTYEILGIARTGDLLNVPLGRLFEPFWSVVALLGIAYAAYGYAIYSAYGAAFGSPFSKDELDGLSVRVQAEPDNAAVLLRNEVSRRADTHGRRLMRAVLFTVLGTVALALALVVGWRVPDKPAQPDASVCVANSVGGVVKFVGPLPDVAEGTLEIVECT